MNRSACIGLLVLVVLCPLILSGRNRLSGNGPAVVAPSDPEQLFVEAMKLAGTKDRVNANKRLDEACLLWTSRGDFERPARARLQIGDLYRKDKRFEESLNQYRQTLSIERLSPSLKAVAYNSIGEVYAELYQTELSLPNYSKALRLARANKDYLVEAQVQLNLASLSFRKGNLAAALDYAQNAVTASRKSNDQNVMALGLGFLAQMELKSGQLEKGRADMDQALALYRETNDLPAQIKALCFLSGMSLSGGQVALAKEQAESALKMAEELARRSKTTPQMLRVNALRWPCWLALARAQRASQQREAALTSYFRATSGTVADWLLVYAATERSLIGFGEERQAAYRELVDLLVELGRTDEAYGAIQYARARTLAGFIHSRPVANPDSDLENKLNALSTSIIALRQRLLSPTLNKPERDALKRELIELEADLAEKRFQAELSRPKRRFVFSQPVNVERLQNSLRDGESVIEFYLGDERSFVWLISRGGVSFETLPGRKEIEAKVRQYVSVLSATPSNLHLQSSITKQRALAEDLFATLLGHVLNQLPAGSKLIVVADGLLNYVPYESLVHNGRYLLQDYEISYLPSSSLIDLLRQQPKPDQVGQMDLLAFGDPVFNQSSKIALTRKAVSRSSSIEELWSIPELARLPRTRDEVEFIGGLIPKERKRLYLGKDSTEKAFKQEPLKQYRWIHFATHSLIDEQNPYRSAVVLSLTGNDNEDGFLRVTEIADLDLNSDLVVLSACETGRGQLLSGEGIIGLSRAFVIAGARSVVVSQWAVSDISTAQLMKDFYQQLVNGIAKPAALREAKLRMLNGGSETRHPYYWAPFVIIGAP